MVTEAIALCVGIVVGIAVGTAYTVLTGFAERVAHRVGWKALFEHRAYRLALAQQVGSVEEADRLMTVYREMEEL